MVLGSQIHREYLGEVTPFGDEDHQEGGGDRSVAGRFLFGDFLDVLGPLVPGVRRAEEEHGGHDAFDRSVREDGKNGQPEGDRDDHMDDEGSRGSQPDLAGSAPSRHDEAGEHGLVRQLPQEDDRKHSEHDERVHSSPSCWDRR